MIFSEIFEYFEFFKRKSIIETLLDQTEVIMDNLDAFNQLIRFNNLNDEFYLITVVDKNLFIPYIVYSNTDLNSLKNDIRRLCKKSGRAYLFLDRKSLKLTLKEFVFNCVEIMDNPNFYNFKCAVYDICCSNKNSIRQYRRFIMDYGNYSFNHPMFYKITIDNNNYCIGYIHKIDKRLLKYLKTTFNLQENSKILIYSKKMKF